MKNSIRCFICLMLLSFFMFGLLTGCRQSPLLEKAVPVNHAEEKKFSGNTKLDNKEEKPQQNTENSNIADHSGQQGTWSASSQKLNIDGTGDIEYGADVSDKGDGLPQVVTDNGITVEVPESMKLVTTVSEATQNPHWKSSIPHEISQYNGVRKDGFFNGQGTYTWDDGEKYTGEWKSGMYDGWGTYTWSNGDRYEGEWKTETFDGRGTYTWASGSYYEGEWKSGVKEGLGTYVWSNGDRYTGEWKAGVKEGLGTYTWADGSVYEGEWKFGIKEGRGTYKGIDGTVLDGLWTNDQFVN